MTVLTGAGIGSRVNAHAITPTYFALASLAGGYLGWVYALTGDIAAPIVAHAAYDFVALLVLVRDDGRAG